MGVRRVIVAGPIGSGKSTVGGLLEERGAIVIDADRIGHAVLEPAGEAFQAVAERWPEALVGGRIDRRVLGEIVFTDPAELATLEGLTHPHIAARIHDLAAAARDAVVVVELPLTIDILGPGWHRLVVIAPDDVRLLRAVARGMVEEDVRSRMTAQPSLPQWTAIADSIIVNDGDLDALRPRVADWWENVVSCPSEA